MIKRRKQQPSGLTVSPRQGCRIFSANAAAIRAGATRPLRIGGVNRWFALSPAQKRISYLAVMALMTLIGITASTALNALIQYADGRFSLVAALTGMLVCGSLFNVVRMREPRRLAAALP